MRSEQWPPGWHLTIQLHPPPMNIKICHVI